MRPAVTLPHDEACRWPRFDQRDEAAVLRVLRDGDASTHGVIRELEAGYRALTGRRFALAHANGTTALMAAFHALDLAPGDEVLVPTATFWASVLPMLWFGLVPVFCASETERLGLDPEDARRRITPRTRAMVTVHLWGLPCRWSELSALASEHGLAVVEDASHAHGASWRGRPCGTLGDVSVFSLQGDKLAPAGEGGVLLTDDERIHERAVCLGDITRILELEGPARRFAATSFGVKTRIAPMSAALGLSQLEKLPEHNARRGANHRRLCAALEELGFDTFLGPPHVERVWFELLVRHRDPQIDMPALLERLRAQGARVERPRYPLLHEQPFFTEGLDRVIGRFPAGTRRPELAPQELAPLTAAKARLLKLPSFPGPDEGLIDQYVEAFRRCV